MTRFASVFCAMGLCWAAVSLAAAGGSGQAVIDCDNGGDLARDVRRAVRSGYSTVYVRGTCVGNFVFDSSGLQLRGDPIATIQGDASKGGFPAAIRVDGPTDLVLRNLLIRDGYFGVQVADPGADVQILDCEIRDNSVGVAVDRGSSVRVWSSEVRNHIELGLIASRGSDLVVRESIVENNPVGIIVREGATLFSGESEIRNHTSVGVEVRQMASADFFESTLSNNGELHVFGSDRTNIEVRSGTVLGAEDDTTQSAAFVDDTSQLTIGSGAEVWGDVTSWSARVRVYLATVHGALALERFSDGIVQANGVVEGGVVCRTGSDALCSGPTPFASDCASTKPDCSTPSASSGDSPAGTERPRPRPVAPAEVTGPTRR